MRAKAHRFIREYALDFDRQQCHASNEVLARIPLSSPPAQLNFNVLIEIADVRRIALHMIGEIARHPGYLDAALELIDGARVLVRAGIASRNIAAIEIGFSVLRGST